MAAANHTEFVFSLSEIILAKKKKMEQFELFGRLKIMRRQIRSGEYFRYRKLETLYFH